MKEECLYTLKGNIHITVFGNITVSNHNINNKLAEAFISTNPNQRKSFFSRLPKDWEERANNYGVVKEEVVVPKEVVEVKKPTTPRKKRTNTKKK